jgi:hypothetical protein
MEGGQWDARGTKRGIWWRDAKEGVVVLKRVGLGWVMFEVAEMPSQGRECWRQPIAE